MEALISYLKKYRSYKLKCIENNYLTQEVKDTLLKYNLTLHELCYRIKHNIPFDKKFTCFNCGRSVEFKGHNGYRKYCSRECENTCVVSKERLDKVQKTLIKKYGVDHYSKTEEYKQKFKQIFLKKYSVDNPLKVVSIQNKMKQTCLERYGVEHYSQTQECKDKVKQSSLNKYGVDNPSQCKEVKKRIKKTNLEKYGVDHYTKSDIYKSKISEIQKKIYDTKKQNNTFHVSSEEEKAYRLLLNKFTKEDIEQQYKSEIYPFNCDFYIKSLDLYIEYNGYWTHGSEPFNKNNSEHIKLLNEWKKKVNEVNFKGKKKSQFESAIYTWTDLDVRKLETFKRNNLNYKIFWNLEEVKDWLRSI